MPIHHLLPVELTMNGLMEWVADAVARLFHGADETRKSREQRLLDLLRVCLDFHRPRFAEIGVQEEAELVVRLKARWLIDNGKPRQVESNVLEDLVLAQACCGQTAQARNDLLERFEVRVDEMIQRRFSPVHGRHFADEREDLWTVCTKSRPKKQTPLLDDFHGETVLWAWLCPILLRHFFKWKKTVEREQNEQAQWGQVQPSHSADTPDQQRQGPSREAIARVFHELRGRLPVDFQLFVSWKVEGRKQKVLAALLKLSEAQISRHFARPFAELPTLVLKIADELQCREEFLDELAAAAGQRDIETLEWLRQLARQWSQDAERRLTELENQT